MSDKRPPFKVGQTVLLIGRWDTNPPVEGMVVHATGSGTYHLMVDGRIGLTYARKHDLYSTDLAPEIERIRKARAVKQALDHVLNDEMNLVRQKWASAYSAAQDEVEAAAKALREKAGTDY